MLYNYILITFRSMMKNKVFIAINVFGLGIAIACCIVSYLAHEYDETFNAMHVNRNSIYRVSSVRSFEGSLKRYGFAPFPLGQIVSKTMPDISQSSRYYHSWSNFKRDNDLFPSNLSYVDPAFFSMFSFTFLSGSPSGLNDVSSVFVSENIAVRLFGTPQEAFGKTVTQVNGTELKEFKIAGVFREPPMNSSFFKPDGCAFTRFENYKDEHRTIADDNWRNRLTLFVRVDDPARVATVHDQLQGFRENNNRVREDFQIAEFTLDSFSGVAQLDRAEDNEFGTWPAPPTSAIVGSMVMGLLIVLIACFNLTNTTIAISSRRLNEIGIRKVMGGMRVQLVFQFIAETTFICFLALLVGIGLADFLVGGWNSMWEFMRLTPHYLDNPSFLLFLLVVLMITGVLAGSYPAFYITKFKAVSVLKGRLKFGGTSFFTRTLLGLQFAISLMAIVSAIGFSQNAQYQKQYDLGYDGRGAVLTWLNGSGEFETYKNALQSNPKVLSIAGARRGLFSDFFHEPVRFESKQADVDVIEVGDNYLATMGLTVLQGRDFVKDSETDQKESILITQKMAKLFHWSDPIGKEIVWRDSIHLFVIGVVKDVYTRGLWREMEPLMIRAVNPNQYTQLVLSAHPDNVSAVNQFMKEQWGKVFPNRLYNGRMLVADLHQVNEVNKNIAFMYTFLGVVAMLLSATGLFTLVSLNIIGRMKEIGVRKVLGASVANIARVVNTEFAVILVIASAFGSWAGFATANMIMGSIWKYYQGANVFTFAASVGLLATVSILTVGYKIYSVATMNPVHTLRDE